MADATTVAGFFANWTPTTWSVIAAFFVGLVALVKVWPLIKAKVNEARKIERDADADLRGDLLGRIKDLEEAQHRDRLDFYTAMGDERKRCDHELDAIRSRLTAAENENKGLQSMIRQNSQSTAQFIGSSESLRPKRRSRKINPER